jgi:hypothetical protein
MLEAERLNAWPTHSEVLAVMVGTAGVGFTLMFIVATGPVQPETVELAEY